MEPKRNGPAAAGQPATDMNEHIDVANQCPACHSDRVAVGHLVSRDLVHFVPDGLRLLKTLTTGGVLLSMSGLRVSARGCTACGHVWSRADPALLLRLLVESGTEETVQRFASTQRPAD